MLATCHTDSNIAYVETIIQFMLCRSSTMLSMYLLMQLKLFHVMLTEKTHNFFLNLNKCVRVLKAHESNSASI
jgi:hypothetical protein